MLEKEKEPPMPLPPAGPIPLFHERNYNQYNKELNNYGDNLIRTQPASMMAALLKGNERRFSSHCKTRLRKKTRLPTIIIFTKGITGMALSLYGMTTDHSLSFFTQVWTLLHRMIQIADTIIRDIDYKLLLARNSPEMYKFMLNWLLQMNTSTLSIWGWMLFLYTCLHNTTAKEPYQMAEWKTDGKKASAAGTYMVMANLVGEKQPISNYWTRRENPHHCLTWRQIIPLAAFWDPQLRALQGKEIPRLDSFYSIMENRMV